MVNQIYKDKNVLVLGLGISGRSAVTFLLDRAAKVVGMDRDVATLGKNPEILTLQQRGLITLQESEPIEIEHFSLVVVSPGVPATHNVLRQASSKGIEIIGEIELACREMKNPFLGITGTNGKTTVSFLIAHVLNLSGKKATVLGNSGTPLTSKIFNETDEVVVCELSSYQLETLRSKVINSGVILNITPDHLDRYTSMENYAKAKIQMGRFVKEGGNLYVGDSVFHEYKALFKREPKRIGFLPVCHVFCDKMKIYKKENIEMILPDQYRGKFNHDIENIMAAFALCLEMGISGEQFAFALESFRKPPHRIEFVRNLCGVSFYNDSKGTNLDAVIRAVESMSGKVVLIAGGKDKGAPFTPWLKAFGDKVRCIFAIGEAQNKLEEQLSRKYSIEKCQNLEIAVNRAFAIAEEGDNVLLSPGCASFDMFRNFEHRGDLFKEIVLAIDR